MRSYVKPLICFLIAILMGTLFLVYMTPPVRRDSLEYHNAGVEVARGDIEVLKGFTYGPTYPAFLGLCFKIFGDNDDAVRLVQVLLSGIMSLMVYIFASRYYGKDVGFIAGLLYSFCPTFGYYAMFFLRETLMVFLFFLSYLLILKAFTRNSIIIAFCAAFSLTLTLLTKPVFLFFGVFVVLFMVIFHREYIRWNKRSACVATVIVLLPIICFSGFSSLIHNDNQDVMSGSGMGITLLYNGSEIALNNKERTARVIGLISRNLSEKIFPEINFRSLWPYPEIAKKLFEMADSKYSHLPNAEDRFLQVAFDLYREYPFGYFINRITTLIRLNAFLYPSRLNETDRWKDFYNRGDKKSWFFILFDIVLKLLTNPFIWFFGGLFAIKGMKRPVFPLLLPVLYVNIVYCFLDGIPRYGLPVLPFYLISGAALFLMIFNRILERWPFLTRKFLTR